MEIVEVEPAKKYTIQYRGETFDVDIDDKAALALKGKYAGWWINVKAYVRNSSNEQILESNIEKSLQHDYPGAELEIEILTSRKYPSSKDYTIVYDAKGSNQFDEMQKVLNIVDIEKHRLGE